MSHELFKVRVDPWEKTPDYVLGEGNPRYAWCKEYAGEQRHDWWVEDFTNSPELKNQFYYCFKLEENAVLFALKFS